MRNKIAFALTIAGGLVLFFGAIGFIVVGVNLNWWIAAADLAGTIIFGLLLLGFGEQIQLTEDVHNELINIKRIVADRSSKQPSDSHSTNKAKQSSVNNAEQALVNKSEQPPVVNAKEYATIDKLSTDGKIVCPKCGTVQNSNRTVCFKCGVFFIDPSKKDG